MSRFFMWRALEKFKAGDLPGGAAVAVGIADHMNVEGHLIMGPQLMTEREVDEEVDSLIAELEAFRQKAKRALQADNSKVAADLANRAGTTQRSD